MQIFSTSARRYAAIAAIAGWVVLALQLYLAIDNRTVSVPVVVGRFFSYFTILTNIMVALSYTVVWLNPARAPLHFMLRSSSLTAVTVYIAMVGVIYNTVLRSLYELRGLALIVDRALHSVLPASLLLFWLVFVPKAGLTWGHAFRWLWYPVAYIMYVILLGALTGFYPYPFANADRLGYPTALLNGLWITGAFLGMSLLFIAVARGMSKKRQSGILPDDFLSPGIRLPK